MRVTFTLLEHTSFHSGYECSSAVAAEVGWETCGDIRILLTWATYDDAEFLEDNLPLSPLPSAATVSPLS